MRYLLVAEKNSLMRQIRDVYEKHKIEIINRIGGEIDFIALSGHIVQWYEPKDYPQWKDEKWQNLELPLLPEPFLIKPSTEKYQQSKLKEWADAIKSGKYTGYINACDPDSEGGLIFWRAAKYLKITDAPTLRFFQNSLTETEILDALTHMEDFYKNQRDIKMLEQALSRSIFDWEVGMNCTISMSVRSGNTSHIGRVKAPTIKLVYDNSEKIDNFTKTVTYLVQVDYEDGFSGVLVDEDGKEIEYSKKEDAESQIIDMSDALEAQVTKVTKNIELKGPEKLYRLSSLQTEAGKKGFSPTEVMGICQTLYEHKYIHYPRTNSQYISSAKANEFPALLKSISCIPELRTFIQKITDRDIQAVKQNKNIVNDAKVKEESHDALIPTEISPDYGLLTENERYIYSLIAKRFLSQFMPKLQEEKTIILTRISGRKFKSTGTHIVDYGWTAIYEKQSKTKEIPIVVSEGSELFVNEYKIHEKETKPVDRLTEATLVSAMENIGRLVENEELKGSLRAGIGTQATRAGIITEIIKDGYVRSEGKSRKLFITDKGKAYIKRLEWSSIISPENAARWETIFTDVRDGNITYNQSIKKCETYVKDFIQQVSTRKFPHLDEKPTLNLKCPYCGGGLKELKYSYSCENTKSGNCSFIVGKYEGKVKESDIKKLIEKGITRKISKICYSKTKDKYYDAALKLNPKGSEKTTTLVFDETIPSETEMSEIKCPYCGKTIKAMKYSFMCEGNEDKTCTFNVNRAEGRVTVQDIKSLINNGKTNVIKKVCYSKIKNQYYDASLELNPKGSEKTTKYVFPNNHKKAM